jgi:TetR/AcrR family transcriptional regulator, transcriptional repressor for nem operon
VLDVDFRQLSKDSLYQFYHEYLTAFNYPGSSFPRNRSDVDSGFDVNYYALLFDAFRLFPSFRAKMLEFFQKEFSAWKEIVHIARKKGEITSPMTDEHIASLFLYTTDGLGLHNMMKGRSQETRKSLLILWDSLYEALKA